MRAAPILDYLCMSTDAESAEWPSHYHLRKTLALAPIIHVASVAVVEILLMLTLAT
jgi:hypothetical protein